LGEYGAEIISLIYLLIKSWTRTSLFLQSNMTG